MYDFIDVTEVSEGVSLPSEALKINGEFIENLIAGYRTLTVEGREALSPEVSSYETGIRDGSVLKGKRYPARVIRITYQLVASSNEEFRNAYNKLASILNVTDAELIFNDETDKFFIGTPSLIGEVKPGRNYVVGEFEILCLDPFKYSVMEYEATPNLDDSSILIDYQGTYKSYPKLEVEFFNEDESSEDGETQQELTGNGDCGFVAFFNEDEKIIQLGDPDEVDKEIAYEASQTLVNQKFNNANAWGSTAKELWALNSGITSSSAVEQVGSIGMSVAAYTSPKQELYSGNLLKITSKANQPHIHYSVTAEMTYRSATTAKVTVMIEARLDNPRSYFGKGYSLCAYVNFNGVTKYYYLKSKSQRWEGTTAYKSSIVFEVTGLTESETIVNGIKFWTTRPDDTGGTAGLINETACAYFTISAYATKEPESYYLAPQGFGTGANWHGPGITRTIPADSSGEVGAKNFTLTYMQKMSIGPNDVDVNELGAFQALLCSGSGTSKRVVAGVNVYKGTSGKKGKLRFYVNNKVTKTMDIDLSYNNKYLTSSNTTVITKNGAVINFDVCGIKAHFNDIAIAETAVTEVTFTLSKFGSKNPLTHNGLYWVKFVKNKCEIWKDIPNKFSANDIVEADCKTGRILLNGLDASAYGALGNDWEGFYLSPGLNRIGFTYSDWIASEYAPSFKVKYREVFL